MSSSASHLAVRPHRRLSRAFITTAVLVVGVIALALAGVGGSYAMWNDTTAVSGSQVASGSTSLTVNGATSYTLPTATLTNLSPGQSALVPITLANTGTTALAATVTSTTVTADSNGLSAELTILATQSSTCTASASAGTRLANFTTASTPITLQANTSTSICLEIKMDTDAPVSVAGGSTTFVLNLTATQVR